MATSLVKEYTKEYEPPVKTKKEEKPLRCLSADGDYDKA
jgi:hypothetical protein